MRGRKSQKSNEPSTSAEVSRKRAVPSSSGSEDSDNEFQEDSGSEDSADLKILSNNLVKYLLNYSASKIPIKRADITKNVNVTQRQFKEVFKSCKKKLKDVYGLDVCEIQESNAPKVFIIHSQFRSAVTALQLLPDQRNELTLLFIILSYIFMKGGETQEGEHDKRTELYHIIKFISICSSSIPVSRANQYQRPRCASNLRRCQQTHPRNIPASTLSEAHEN